MPRDGLSIEDYVVRQGGKYGKKHANYRVNYDSDYLYVAARNSAAGCLVQQPSYEVRPKYHILLELYAEAFTREYRLKREREPRPSAPVHSRR